MKQSNLNDVKQFQKAYHKWSQSVESFDFRKTPKAFKKQYLNDEEFKVYLQLPYSRTDYGLILVNESLPEWELLKDFLVALDSVPDSLLLDIYKMECRRNTGDIENMDDCDNDEKKRRILFKLLPEIIWAHSNKK